MVIVKFKDFKVGDHIVVSTENASLYEVKAVGIFDNETAFLLTTGQGVSMDYEGEILLIEGDMVTVSSGTEKKKLHIGPKTLVMKDMERVDISAFSPGDSFYAKASFSRSRKT